MGDELLQNKQPKQAINEASPLSFIKTFYAAYVSEYCNMPEGLQQRLYKLRSTHLTAGALAQFKSAEREQEVDGVNNWDLLVAGFDFDCLWISSMAYEQLNERTFEMRYAKAPGSGVRIRLELARSGQNYKIDKIHIEKGPW